ncbi:MAG: mechanosensitive ion channel domain-containing protein [Desulfuromonadaceae bacterium]
MRTLILCVSAMFILLPASVKAEAQGGAAESSVQTITEAPPVYSGAADVVPQAIKARQDMAAAQERIKGLRDLSTWENILKERKTKQQELSARMQDIGDLHNQSFERLLRISTLLQTHKKNLQADIERISTQTSELENMRKRWRERYDYWGNWREELKKQDAEFPGEEFTQVLEQNKLLRENVVSLSGDYIRLQKQFTDLLEANSIYEKQVDTELQNMRSTTFKKTAPSFVNPAFYSQFSAELANRVAAEIAQVDWLVARDIAAGWWIVLLQLIVVLVAVYTIRHYTVTHHGNKQWAFLMAHPWASGIFIAGVALGSLYQTPSLMLRFYLALLVVLSACVLVTGIVEKRRHRNLVWLLGGAYLMTLFMQVVNLPLPIMRVFIAALAVVLLMLLIPYCVMGRKDNEHWSIIGAMRIGIGICLISLVAQFGGYSNLSARLVDASFKTVFLALMVTMVIKLTQGGVNFAVNHRRAQSVYFFRTFGAAFKEQLNAIIKLVVLGSAILALGKIWSGSSSIAAIWDKVAYVGIEISGLQIDIATLLNIGVVMYCAVVLSWFVRSMFDAGKIGPRYIDSGVRDSIKSLIHYFIIFCGVVFAFSAAGIGLQNFAVIAGALSIGIGFGLQNIVNNFISGIILLFERPIRKGDTIILDGEWAIVRNIGLRSTVVETFNKAELIVPNSDLISQKVTNLTHSNAQFRVVMDVGTAYGSDMEQVLKILQDEAAKHPQAAKNPAPSALFVGFGDSSLDFKLRIWLNNLDYCLSIVSEVGIAVYKRFAEEGVEIPFPQQDLHVRSMDEKVVEAWRGKVEVHNNDTGETQVISE